MYSLVSFFLRNTLWEIVPHRNFCGRGRTLVKNSRIITVLDLFTKPCTPIYSTSRVDWVFFLTYLLECTIDLCKESIYLEID